MEPTEHDRAPEAQEAEVQEAQEVHAAPHAAPEAPEPKRRGRPLGARTNLSRTCLLSRLLQSASQMRHHRLRRLSSLVGGAAAPVAKQQELHVGVQPHARQVRPERHIQLGDLLKLSQSNFCGLPCGRTCTQWCAPAAAPQAAPQAAAPPRSLASESRRRPITRRAPSRTL